MLLLVCCGFSFFSSPIKTIGRVLSSSLSVVFLPISDIASQRSLYDKKKIARWLEDLNFIFSC